MSKHLPIAASSFHHAVARRAEACADEELVRLAGCSGWNAAELWQRSLAIAGGLAATVRTGETVATCLPAGPESIAVTTALSVLGAVEMPLTLDPDPRWAQKLAAETCCVAAVASKAALARAPHLGKLGRSRRAPLISMDHPHAGAVLLDDLVASPTPVRRRRRAPGDPALIMTTSGTTGRTKGAVLPVAAGPGQAERVQRAMRYDESDVLYNCFPWQHINARHAGFLPAVLSGARLVVDSRFTASRFLDIMRAESVTAFNFMGAVCAMLLRQPESEVDRDHGVRRAYGGPAPAELVAAMHNRFDIALLQAYACTELGDVATSSASDMRPGAAGRPVPEYCLRVVNESGSDVQPGVVGELLARPERPHLSFIGYAGDPGATSLAWRDGWFRTGDQVRLVDGWLYVEGRSADVVRRRGINISPDVVEEVISTMPGVAEVAVIGVPSELTEDEVLAIVVPDGACILDPADVRRHCAGRLPRHALPRFVSLAESLPHSATLKLSRADLRRAGLPPSAWDAESAVSPGPPPQEGV